MRSTWGSVAVVLLGLLSIAATRFVAMRVDLEPVRTEGDATRVVLVVQVAPEDRPRIGATAWLEGEIRRGEAVVARLARAAELDEGGAVRLEMALPPGAYEVRVELRSGSGRDAGRWEGRVVVPRLDGTAGSALPSPPPPPLLAPSPVASETLDAEPAPHVDEAGPGGAEAEPAPTMPSPEVPEAVDPATQARTPHPVATPAPAAGEPPPAREVPPPSGAGAAGVAAAPPAELPTPSAPEIVVPPTATSAAPSPASAPGPASWGSDRPDLADLTVIATDRDRPVLGLSARDLTLELDGREVAVERMGGAGDAPLLLGVAVDGSRALAEELAEIRSLVGRLSLRAAGGRGDLFLVRSDGDSRMAAGWGATPEDLAAALAAPGRAEASDLARLVTDALARFEGRSGRRVLLAVVGGGDTASRSDWKTAYEAAESAGVPVLVVGFKGELLEDRTRGAFERISELSGGKDYWLTLRDTGLLNLVSEHYGDLLDASYALRFSHPAPGRAERAKVEAAGGSTEVRHSRRVR